MKYPVYLFVALVLFSCRQSPADGLEIPDQVKSEKTNVHVQLPGTCLFVVSPKNYDFNAQMIRFQKADSATIMFMEMKGKDFIELKPRMQDTLRKIEKATGTDMYLEKEFKLENYDALLFYGPDNREEYDMLMLMLGDKDYSVMVMAQIRRGSTALRDEVVNCMLSLVADESAVVNVASFETYSIDHEKSDFKYVNQMSQLTIYTTTEDKAVLQDPFLSNVMVMSMPTMTTDERKQYALGMLERYKGNGIVIKRVMSQGEVTINGMDAYEIIFEGSFQGKDNVVYQVVTGDAQTTLLMAGIAYEKHEKYLQQFKDLAETIRMK